MKYSLVITPTTFDQNAVPGAHQYRTQLRAWLNAVSDEEHRRDLQARLGSKSGDQHFSARLEIALDGIFRGRGWSLTYHPAMTDATTRPDFRVTTPLGDFLCEAVITLEEDEVQQQQRYSAVMDEISKIDPRFTVWMRPRVLRETGPLMRRLRPFLERNLGQLAREGMTEPVELCFEDPADGSGERLDFTVYPGRRGMDDKGLRGISHPARSFAPHEMIRTSLEGKAAKYGREQPESYLIVNWAMPMTVDDYFIELALFDERDGFFTQAKGNRRMNSNVSAVAFYYCLLTEDGAQFILRIFHNPYAERPLNRHLFDGHPQCNAFPQPDGTFTYTWVDRDLRLER